jgi:hypothetical protein
MTISFRSGSANDGILSNGTEVLTATNLNVSVNTALSTSGNITANGVLVPTGATIINNTNAASDIALAVGQVAYVDATSSTSVPLHIATSDNQIYQVWIQATSETGGSAILVWYPNNINYGSVFTRRMIYGAGSATSVASANLPNYPGIGGGSLFAATLTVRTNVVHKVIEGTSAESSTSTSYHGYCYVYWQDTTTQWTSLGTASFLAAWSGRIIIKRVL